jgi:hypothetical protein
MRRRDASALVRPSSGTSRLAYRHFVGPGPAGLIVLAPSTTHLGRRPRERVLIAQPRDEALEQVGGDARNQWETDMRIGQAAGLTVPASRNGCRQRAPSPARTEKEYPPGRQLPVHTPAARCTGLMRSRADTHPLPCNRIVVGIAGELDEERQKGGPWQSGRSTGALGRWRDWASGRSCSKTSVISISPSRITT